MVISWAYFGNRPKKLKFFNRLLSLRGKWTGYQTSEWSSFDMQLSCNTSFMRCENLILIIVNHDSTQALLKFVSGKGIQANHATEEGAVPVYIKNQRS